MVLTVTGFDWDDGNHAKCQKHGVSIAEIEALFRGGPLVAPAPSRSATAGGSMTEDRLIAVGRGPSALRRIYTADRGARPADPSHLSPVHARQGDSSV